jgi:hypothetical protein
MFDSVAFTVTVLVADALERVPVIVADPGASAVSRPVVLICATAMFELVHVTFELMFFALPSE